jgi:hypothetical protein
MIAGVFPCPGKQHGKVFKMNVVGSFVLSLSSSKTSVMLQRYAVPFTASGISTRIEGRSVDVTREMRWADVYVYVKYMAASYRCPYVSGPVSEPEKIALPIEGCHANISPNVDWDSLNAKKMEPFCRADDPGSLNKTRTESLFCENLSTVKFIDVRFAIAPTTVEVLGSHWNITGL